ncbi:MAG TPA: hypothetical protein VMQ67_03840 [Candidatus Saccharimonadales bacterium]|nr:hypothetical protein [Candidatus Saccharimonadales bacterium]
MPFDPKYFDCEGPLGLPMKDAQAKLLDSLLQNLPAEDRELTRLVTIKAPAEVLDGERADVSWITTEEIDREGEIVIARGMNDSHFKLNPIVTAGHSYCTPPVGRSLWRKRAKDGEMVGIKAKTQYPKRPDNWLDCWPPDTTLMLIQAGMMQGKSIGFLRLKSHQPNSHEIAGIPALAQVDRIIDEWLLIEYACTFLPVNQASIVEAVSKGTFRPDDLKALGLTVTAPAHNPTQPTPIPFTPLEEIHKSISNALAGFDFEALARRAVSDGIDRAKGRI